MRGVALVLALWPGVAVAHGGHVHPEQAESLWTWNPLVFAPLALSAGLYGLGAARLWRNAGFGRGVRPWQALCFAAGWLLLFGALVAPLHWLGERLFSAHMIEHEILMGLAAPLIAVARPGGAMMWGLPARWRSAVGGATQAPVFAGLWRGLTHPGMATAIHGVALWAWHAPLLFNAALRNDFVHWLQHVSFLVTALLFWWALLRSRERERGYGGAVLYLFLTAAHSGFLGVLIALARRPVYPLQSENAALWGLSPLEDQQLAGLIMWVPFGLIYALAALVLAGVWITGVGARAREGHAALH
jgi:cytochrome c oxidase assembly factor CtaG